MESVLFPLFEATEKNIDQWLIICHGVTFHAQSQGISINKRLFTGTENDEENIIG